MSTTITAAVLRQFRSPLALETLTLDAPQPDEVLVKLHSVGICHTDVKIMQGYLPVPLPVVLGHEGAGVVAAVGEQVQGIMAGDHVVLSFNACGNCAQCLARHPAYCDHAGALTFSCQRPGDGGSPLHSQHTRVNGYFFGQSSFASHAITTAANVVKIPPNIPLTLPGVLGCGVQTGAGAVLNVLKPQAGQSLAIFGTGSVGLSALMAAVIAGVSPLIAVDVNPSRLAMALQLGATHILNPQIDTDLVASIKSITQGKGVHYSLDTTNNPIIVRQAFECLGNRGTYGHLGGGGKDLSFPASHLLAGRTITGIVQGDSHPQTFIPQLLNYYLQDKFPFDKLIRHYPFSEINQAIADMEAGRCIKPVLLFDQNQ
jgi:aryl-alcohol dehydrogenase